MSKNILKNATFYLSGPMQNCPNGGVFWRQKVKDYCKNENILCKFFDPTAKIGSKDGVNVEKQTLTSLRQAEKWDDLCKYAKTIVKKDLRANDLSDAIIVYLDTAIPACGTWNELFFAIQQRKPPLIIMEGGKMKTPDWLFGVVNHNNIFDTVEDLCSHLTALNNGTVPLDDKWVVLERE